MAIRSARALADRVAVDPVLEKQIREDPVGALNRLAVGGGVPPDVWIYRMVVAALGLAILGVVGGVIALTLVVSSIPEVVTQILTAIGSASVGALAGLLSPRPDEGA